MDKLDLRSLFMQQQAAPPAAAPYQYGPDQGSPGQEGADTFGYGPAPQQPWTPPAANQPGVGGMVQRGLGAAQDAMGGASPEMVNKALKAAEDAFNSVLQGAGEMGGKAADAATSWWDQMNPPTLQRPQPGQSPTYPAPDRSGPPFLERPQPGQSPEYLSPPVPFSPDAPAPYQKWQRPEFDQKKRLHRRWET